MSSNEYPVSFFFYIIILSVCVFALCFPLSL